MPGRHGNLVLLALVAAAQIWLLVLQPLCGAEWPWPTRVTGLALPVLLTLPTWSLLHEAIHNNLSSSWRLNHELGRLLSILFGAPFEVLRCGHLLHHRFSRREEISEAYDPALSSWGMAALRHYSLILGGLYWAEVLLGLVVWLPRRRRDAFMARFSPPGLMTMLFRDRINQPRVLAELRMDGMFCLLLFAAAFLLYGTAWPLLLAALAGRAFLVSFFDNAYHYATRTGRPELARNHRFPWGLSWLVLHFNYHGVHHLHPSLPWHALPAKARETGAEFSGGYFSAPLMQLRGPLSLQDLSQRA